MADDTTTTTTATVKPPTAEEIRLEEDLLKVKMQMAKTEEERRAVAEEVVQNEIKQLEILSKQAKLGENERMALLARAELLKQMLKDSKEMEQIQRNLMGHTDNLLTSMIGIEDRSQGFIGSLLAADDPFKAMGTSIANMLAPMNVLSYTLETIQEATMLMVWQTDEALASFNRVTGTAGAYNEQIVDSWRATNHLAVSMAESAEAASTLHMRVTAFRNMAPEVQSQMIATAATLTRLGISAQSGAMMMATMMESLDMTGTAAATAAEDLIDYALQIGMAPNEMVAGWDSAMPRLAAHGNDAIEIFKGMAAASRALQIDMGALMGVVGQFDTFEGAANAAGRLNAILGGDMLNSMEMLLATEEERVKMLLQSFEATGKNWEAMGKYERMAVASALGIDDMNEANQLFNTTLSEYERSLITNTSEQERLAAAEAAGISIKEKLKAIMDALAVAILPIVTGIRWFLDGILRLNEVMGGTLVPAFLVFAGILVIIGLAVKALIVLQSMYAGVQAASAAITGTSATANQALAVSQLEVAAATELTAGAVQALGVSLGAAAAESMGLLHLMVLAVISIAAAVASIAIAVTSMAAAFATALVVLYLIIDAFMKMPEAINPALMGLLKLGGIIAIFTGIFAALSPSAPLAAAAMITIGIGMLALAYPMIIFAGALAIFAVAMKTMGEALQEFAGLSMDTILSAAKSLIIFGTIMIAASLVLNIAALAVGPAIALLGLGLMVLGKGIQEFEDMTVTQMFGAAVSLLVFAMMMIALSPFMTLAGLLVGTSVVLLGLGLILLGKGIQEFEDMTVTQMFKVAGALLLFARLMIAIGVFIGMAALLVGPAVALLGAGLLVLAIGINRFADTSLETMAIAAASLMTFAVLMIGIGVFLSLAAVLLGPALIAIGLSLMMFAAVISSIATSIESIAVLSDVITSLAMADQAAEGVLLLAGALWQLNTAIRAMPDKKLIAVEQSMKQITETATAAGAGATATNAARTTGPVEAIANLTASLTGGGSEGKKAQTAPTNQAPREIKLIVNDRELGKIIDEHLEKKHNLVMSD